MTYIDDSVVCWNNVLTSAVKYKYLCPFIICSITTDTDTARLTDIPLLFMINNNTRYILLCYPPPAVVLLIAFSHSESSLHSECK